MNSICYKMGMAILANHPSPPQAGTSYNKSILLRGIRRLTGYGLRPFA